MATCPSCGKASYSSRSDAKTMARRLGLKGAGNRPYPCPEFPGYYHLGHLAEDIIKGTITRAQAYGMDEAEKWARNTVAMRAHHLCEVCGGRGQEFSHRRTRAVRDDHLWCPCNALLSCHTCHATMHAGPVEARRVGQHVSRYIAEPATVPVQLSVGWAMLDCDGGGRVVPAEQVIDEYGTPRLLGPGQPNR